MEVLRDSIVFDSEDSCHLNWIEIHFAIWHKKYLLGKVTQTRCASR